MPTFNIAEGKLSVHHSLKIKSKRTAAEESEGYRKGMGIQCMTTRGRGWDTQVCMPESSI